MLLATAPRRVMMWLAASWESWAEGEPVPGPESGLRRVVVLMRHGNRAPNVQLWELCAPLAEEVFPQFGVSPESLTRVGMAEAREGGRFVRQRYGNFLPQGAFLYDGTYAFNAEAASRNVVSAEAFAEGMFPEGTGLRGYLPERPNLVPVLTSEAGADVMKDELLNEDGPCWSTFVKDMDAWNGDHERDFYQKHESLFEEVSKVCEFPLKPGLVAEGKQQSLLWAAKIVSDAFTFVKNEGLNTTLHGRLGPMTIKRLHEVVAVAVNDWYFGRPHQLTYWTGDFIPETLKLAHLPLPDPHKKFQLLLNHRELLYATAHQLGIPIAFPGAPPDTLTTSSSLIIEVYDAGVRLLFWSPSQPSLEEKARYAAEGLPVVDLYGIGTLLPARMQGCPDRGLCPLEELVRAHLDHVRQTGAWFEICNAASEGDERVRRAKADQQLLERWLSERSPGASPAAAAFGGSEASDSGIWPWGAAGLLWAFTGSVAWFLGRRSAQKDAERVASGCYLVAA